MNTTTNDSLKTNPQTSPFRNKVQLGRSGLSVSKLGLGSSYGGTSRGYEKAFEHGVNYFYWGSIKRDGMRDAIRNIAQNKREDLKVVLQSYSRWAPMLRWGFERSLKSLRIDYADILLLGWFNKNPSPKIFETVLKLKEQGLVKAVAISCHHRPQFLEFIKNPAIDIIMVRYNAAHRGAEREVFPHLDSGGPRPGVVSYTTTRWGFLVNPKYTPPGEKTPTATDCYRFALTNPNVNTVLSGPKTDEELEDNLKALDLGPMNDEELAWIKRVGDYVHKKTAKGILTNPFNQREQ